MLALVRSSHGSSHVQSGTIHHPHGEDMVEQHDVLLSKQN